MQLSNLHCAARERGLHHSKSAGSGSAVPGGAATCSEGFVKCFLRVPRLLGCTAAAMLPKQARGSFRKHVTKPHPVDCSNNLMGDAPAMINDGSVSPATLAPKVETTSVFKSFWPGRKPSNVALNLEGE